MKNYKIWAFAAIIAMLAVACSPENVDDMNGTKSSAFKVAMTDSPADFEELNVSIVKVEAYTESGQWVTLNNQTQVVSVLELTNGKKLEIAEQSELDAGIYSKLRITFGEDHSLTANAAVALDLGFASAGGDVDLDLQYEGDREIVIEIDEEINAENSAYVLVDFNVAQSIYQNGSEMILKPVLTHIRDTSTAVSGQVSGTASAMITLTDGENTLSTFTNAEGEFLLQGMEDGVFDLEIMPSEDDLTSPEPEPIVVEGVVVTQGEITNAGSFEF